MIKNLVLYGGSFDPPGLHHERIVDVLEKKYERTIVVPCGNGRRGKTMHATPTQRRDLCIRAFLCSIVGLDDHDLTTPAFTPIASLQERYATHAQTVWHVIGSDLIQGGERGESEIQRLWKNGVEIWNELSFVVIERPGYSIQNTDLPPRHRLLTSLRTTGSSTEIRHRITKRKRYEHLVSPQVEEYIRRHELYLNASRN